MVGVGAQDPNCNRVEPRWGGGEGGRLEAGAGAQSGMATRAGVELESQDLAQPPAETAKTAETAGPAPLSPVNHCGHTKCAALTPTHYPEPVPAGSWNPLASGIPKLAL